MKFVAKISILTVILTAQSSLAAEPVVPVDHFKTSDPELEVTIWAQSPMLKNPTNFDFDKDGRLYVAEGVNYRLRTRMVTAKQTKVLFLSKNRFSGRRWESR